MHQLFEFNYFTKMSFFSFILLASSVSAASIDLRNLGDIEIRDCGSKVEITRIEFDQCEEFPCVVHHGETATGRAHMVSRAATQSLTCSIIGIIDGVELPFNGCPRDACENLSIGDCAVEEGEELVYDMAIPILAAYPTIELEGKWMLKDDSGENFFCLLIPMKIEP